MIKIFIGYDKSESGAAYVLAHSIQSRASIIPAIAFLNRDTLRGIFTRERGPKDSTDFSISRFLVPYLCNYEGYAIFMDCDMVCMDDIAKLWAWRDELALRVVKHNYIPQETTKFLGQEQTQYSKKNWSSVMLFNNAKCKSLTKEYVNSASGLDLHQFKWIGENEVGDLPNYWNKLVGHDRYDHPSLIHYTTGGPYFKQYANCEHAQEWWEAKDRMLKFES